MEELSSTVAFTGDSVWLTCVVQDMPTITWFRDGCEIEEDSRISIKEDDSLGDKLKSILFIRRATIQDKGYYTCVSTVPMRQPLASVPILVVIFGKCIIFIHFLYTHG